MIAIENKENCDANDEQERTLIRQAKQGYAPAFTRLVSLHQKGVFRLAYGFFQDRDDAMEIVQDTFLRVYQKLDSYDENTRDTRFSGWVNRIAYNLCIDYYRKFKKKKAEMQDIYQFEEENKTTSHFPEDHLDRQNFQSQLERLVQSLPKQQQKIFLLKHYSGYKHHEISSMLNVSVGAIKSLYFRAVHTLKKALAPELSTLKGQQWPQEVTE